MAGIGVVGARRSGGLAAPAEEPKSQAHPTGRRAGKEEMGRCGCQAGWATWNHGYLPEVPTIVIVAVGGRLQLPRAAHLVGH